MEKIKNIIFCLVIGFMVASSSKYLDSTFFQTYLENNLITLLVALLAINITTISVIMTKLKELSSSVDADFSNTIRALKYSILEQVVLIFMAIVVFILAGSAIVLSLHSLVDFILEGLLCAVFIASMSVLYDTANSIFIILTHENNK